MASGRDGGRPARPSRPGRGSVPNEDGLRALGAQVQGGTPAPARGARRAGAGGPVANEKGLRNLGETIDRSAGGAKGRRRRRSGKPKWSLSRKLLTAAVVVVALAAAAAGGGWGYLTYRFDQLQKTAVPAEEAEVPGQPFNVLVVGSDSRVGETGFGSTAEVSGQRSDVVMIWHVDPATRSIQVLSIPRDTLVSMVGQDVSTFGTFNRINSSYNSGVNQLVQTIEDNFGIPINHVVQVDFAGFMGSVQALDGVYLNFNYPAKDVWSGLDVTGTGCQLLDGAQALSVARSRHYEYYQDGYWQYDGTGDFGRIQRQDAFLRALIKAAESKLNPLTVNAFVGSLHEGIVIDDRFTAGEVAGLAWDFRHFDPSSLQTQTLPTTSIGYVSPWGDVLFVDQPAAQQMLVSIFGSQLSAPTSPPPDTSLTPSPPPVVTTTTAPAATTVGASGSGAAGATADQASPTTTTTAPLPSFDPTSCSPS